MTGLHRLALTEVTSGQTRLIKKIAKPLQTPYAKYPICTSIGVNVTCHEAGADQSVELPKQMHTVSAAPHLEQESGLAWFENKYTICQCKCVVSQPSFQDKSSKQYQRICDSPANQPSSFKRTAQHMWDYAEWHGTSERAYV